MSESESEHEEAGAGDLRASVGVLEGATEAADDRSAETMVTADDAAAFLASIGDTGAAGTTEAAVLNAEALHAGTDDAGAASAAESSRGLAV